MIFYKDEKYKFNEIFNEKNGLFLFLLTTGEALVAKASEASTDERSHDEEPQLRHSQRVLGEDGNAE